MKKDKEVKAWLKERNKVVKTYDVDAFKKFYEKWMAKGFYTMPLPNDLVIALSMRKMVYHMASATEQEKQEAAEWLKAHGSSTEL